MSHTVCVEQKVRYFHQSAKECPQEACDEAMRLSVAGKPCEIVSKRADVVPHYIHPDRIISVESVWSAWMTFLHRCGELMVSEGASWYRYRFLDINWQIGLFSIP